MYFELSFLTLYINYTTTEARSVNGGNIYNDYINSNIFRTVHSRRILVLWDFKPPRQELMICLSSKLRIRVSYTFFFSNNYYEYGEHVFL